MIPGRLLHLVAGRLCSSTFRDQVVEPLLADVQHEWQRATGFVQRAVILGRGYGAFWRAFG